jgi:hypothetical protein
VSTGLLDIDEREDIRAVLAFAADRERRLGDLYPGTTHVRTFNLQSATDERIWLVAVNGRPRVK